MQCMAQEGSEASVASSPPPPPPPSYWWRDMHPYAPPAAAAPRWPPPPSSGADDDLSASNATVTSFTNTSTNHSGLSMNSAAAAAAEAAAESHMWNQVLLGTGAEVGRSMHVHDNHDDGENFLDLLNAKTLAPEMFAEPPACDYLKKMAGGGTDDGANGGGWAQFAAAAPSPLGAAMDRHLSSSYGAGALQAQPAAAPQGRLTHHLADLVSNWSIAPPDPCLDGHRLHGGAEAGRFLEPRNGMSHVKHESMAASSCHALVLEGSNVHSGCMSQEQLGTPPVSSLLRPVGFGYSSLLGLSNKLGVGGGGGMDVPWSAAASNAARSLSDLISFGAGPPGKPAVDVRPLKPVRSSETFEYKKQGRETSPSAKTSSKGSATSSDGKKKRCEDQLSSEGNPKKSKNEATSPTSSLKSQVPKVKLGDKITALQQIVSPFGKTDTASVLYEAINYIKFLHEQVQLLSDPYLKSSSSTDYSAWGGMGRKEKAEASDADLRSRGLCLVPVSCTPQIYADNSVPDYWTPPYRSCLYR